MTEAKTTGGLYAALAKFQQALPKVGKEGEGQYGKYARLEDVSQATLTKLGELGLAFITRPTVHEGQLVLAYSLVHVSGEREDGFYPLMSNGTPQQIGGAITYARRYALCAVTGVAPAGDDDDGQSAQQAADAPRVQQPDWRHPPPRPAGQLPRNTDGSLSRSRITDAELGAAGVMTGEQQKEHTALRKGAVTGKAGGTVERVQGKAPDDEWTAPAETAQDGQAEDGTDQQWYADVEAEIKKFTSDDYGRVLWRRVSEKVEAGGCSRRDGERLQALIRARHQALAVSREAEPEAAGA